MCLITNWIRRWFWRDKLAIVAAGETIYVTDTTGTRAWAWADVDEVWGYKVDWGAIDQVCFDLVIAGQTITVTEDMSSYPWVVKQLQDPSVDSDWFAKLALPAFATNRSCLYRRQSVH